MKGKSNQELANIFECSKYLVSNRLKKMNLFRESKETRNKKRLLQLGEKNSIWNDGTSYFEFICENCGKKVKRERCGRDKARFCSNKCAHEFMPNYFKNKIGPKHPCWKENKKSTLKEFIRTTYDYKKWRKSVFERDNYTCQVCNRRGGYLEAHHIKAFAEIIDENNITTYDEALLCELLWDIDNGMTICVKCHSELDKNRKRFLKNNNDN